MSGLFGGDPRMLFLDGEDGPLPQSGAETPPGTPGSPGAPGSTEDDGLSPEEALLALAAEALPDTGVTLDLAQAARVAEDAAAPPRSPRSSLIERVRTGAVRDRVSARPDVTDVAVFDHGYAADPAPKNQQSLLERVRGATAGPAEPSPGRRPSETVSLPDPVSLRAHRPAGSDLEAEASTERIRVADTVLRFGRRPPAREEPTPERSTGPLRIFVGGTGTTREEALRDDARGPVWDAASLGSRARARSEASGDWGVEGSGAPSLAVSEATSLDTLEAEDTELDVRLALAVETASVSEAPEGEGDEGTPHTPAADAGALSSLGFQDRSDPSGAEDEQDGPAAPLDTADGAPRLPPFSMEPWSRLQEQLSQPLRDPPSTTVQRQAPYADPDPWTTGAFRRIAVPTPERTGLPPQDSLDSLDSLTMDRRAGEVPLEVAPMVQDPVSVEPKANRSLMLVLGALLVVSSAVVWIQLTTLRDRGRAAAPAAGPAVASLGEALGEHGGAAGPAGPEAALQVRGASAENPALLFSAEASVEQAASSLPPLAPREVLRAEAEMGLLEVWAADGLWVSVDGKRVGRTPLSVQRLPAGAHAVRVGGRETRITVAPGRLTQIQF